jgi:hypothetical protein
MDFEFLNRVVACLRTYVDISSLTREVCMKDVVAHVRSGSRRGGFCTVGGGVGCGVRG